MGSNRCWAYAIATPVAAHSGKTPKDANQLLGEPHKPKYPTTKTAIRRHPVVHEKSLPSQIEISGLAAGGGGISREQLSWTPPRLSAIGSIKINQHLAHYTGNAGQPEARCSFMRNSAA